MSIALVCGLAMLLPAMFNPSPARAATLVVDDFSTFQADAAAYPDPGISLPKDSWSSVTGPGILGGERDLRAQANVEDVEPFQSGIYAGVDNGQFESSSQPPATGTITLQWDGPDGDGASLDPTGLDGVDLTSGGTEDAFSLSVIFNYTDATVLTINVYTDADNYSTFDLDIGQSGRPAEHVIRFESFVTAAGGGADFTDAGAITISYEYGPGGGQGPYIDDFQTTSYDTTPPVTTASLSGTTEASGWYRSAVQVTLNATDDFSGVASTSYSLDGGSVQTYSGPFTVSAQGNHTVNFYSTDNDANVETAKSTSFKIDSLAPTITGSALPAANANGWNNTPVTVSFECADAPGGSGIDTGSVTTPVSLNAEGANQSADGICFDLAGNKASTLVSNINIDMTAPTVAAGGPYVVNEGSTISLDGSGSTDGLSGIASIAWALDGDGQFDDPDPASFSGLDGPASIPVALQVTDLAGNVDTVNTTVTVNNVAPQILSVTNDGPPGSGSLVNVSVDATDPAGDLDQLRYEFDCNNDQVYEVEPQAGNSTACDIGVQEGGITVNVRVTDGDGGEALGSTVISVPTELCVNNHTNALRYSENGCQSHETLVILTGEDSLTFCVSNYNHLVRYLRAGNCSWSETLVTLPDDGPLSVCVSRYTQVMRAVNSIAQCQPHESGHIIGNGSSSTPASGSVRR